MIKHSLTLSCTVALAGFLVSGCAMSGYGSLLALQQDDIITIEMLLENWEDYEIHFTGLSRAHPSAVIFDLKGDKLGMLAKNWIKVEDKEMLKGLVNAIGTKPPVSGYSPGLKMVLGPDSNLYGYMYTSWNHAVLKAVDENTLSVYGIPLPPYLEMGWERSRFEDP